MVEHSPSIMIIIILITIPMLGPECKYLNGPEISFRSEAVFAACRLIWHIWDSTHIASNHLSVGQDLSSNELIFVSTWFPGKQGWIWLKSSHTFVRLEAVSRNVNDQQMETWSPGEVWTPTARCWCWCWWWASFIFWSFFSYGTMCSNQSTMAVQFPSRTIMHQDPLTLKGCPSWLLLTAARTDL